MASIVSLQMSEVLIFSFFFTKCVLVFQIFCYIE